MYDPQQYNADHIVPQGTTGVSFFAVMKNVYLWMTLALAITGLTAMAVATQPQMVYSIASNSLVFWGLLLAELGLVWFISARIMSLSVTTAGVLFAIYALLNGVTFSFIFLVYTASSIAQTFFITAGVFAAMGLVGLFIKRDLSTFGRIFYMALIGLIIASVANWFFKNDMLMSICNYLGVIIFTGLTAYDRKRSRTSSFLWAAPTMKWDSASLCSVVSRSISTSSIFSSTSCVSSDVAANLPRVRSHNGSEGSAFGTLASRFFYPHFP